MEEIYKPIRLLDGLYSASNLGNIKRETREVNHNYPGYKAIKTEKLCKQHINRGYKYVTIRINGVKKNYFVHRLVAEAFIIKIPGLHIVNHINGNPSDNSVENLEWSNYKRNWTHAVEHLKTIVYKGENSNFHKLKEQQVIEIKQLLQTKTNAELGKLFCVHANTIRLIRLGKTWKA